MEEKTMKAYKGYNIQKSYDLKGNGTIDKASIVYTAYDADGNLFDANGNLSALKKKIDNYAK